MAPVRAPRQSVPTCSAHIYVRASQWQEVTARATWPRARLLQLPHSLSVPFSLCLGFQGWEMSRGGFSKTKSRD